MPTDLETQALIERDMLDRLTAEFVSLPRSLRRRISRDTARHYARPGDRNGKCADRIRPRKPKQLSGFMNTRSGQARINAKRNARAEFWRTFTIAVSTEMEPYFREHLHLLGKGARIHRSRPAESWFGFNMDVHIPGAPAHAVRAEPIYRSVHIGDGHYRPELDSIEWYDAHGKQIDAEHARIQRVLDLIN